MSSLWKAAADNQTKNKTFKVAVAISPPFDYGRARIIENKLHLVFGGRISDPRTLDFNDFHSMGLVGIFPNYNDAEESWRAKAQATVYDAEMKYVVVHLHRLLEPEFIEPPKKWPSGAAIAPEQQRARHK